MSEYRKLGTPGRCCGWGAIVAFALAGCSPTVKVEAPSEPITINMNIKIQHDVLVRVDREVEDLLSENSGLFE